jgi:hypothetical protein
LVAEWQFSALYPLTKISECAGSQSVEWHISAAADGTLTNKADAEESSYLYWEAKALVNLKPSLTLPFDPSYVNLSPSNGVLLPFADVVPHLHTALKALSLGVEARTSFITYWLPEMMRFEHQHIAFRFIPQLEYERAAPLRVDPQPDCVTRVFWCFKGVPNDEVADGQWAAARERAATVDWPGVVGLHLRAFDACCFRVLEWCVVARSPARSWADVLHRDGMHVLN